MIGSFAAALRTHIRAGESPRVAMRSAWQDVRAGHAARPPRRGKLVNPLSVGGTDVDVVTPAGGKVFHTYKPARHVALSVNPLSHEEHVRLSAWAQFGPRHFITRVGRRRNPWTVEGLGPGHPSFRTRRAAEQYVDGFIREQSQRARVEEPRQILRGWHPKKVGTPVHGNPSSDPAAERELRLFIDNDAELYRSQMVPIQNNLRRRMKKGTYDPAKAEKLWRYLVDRGAKKYAREFAGGVPAARRIFPGDVRAEVARELARHWEQEVELGNPAPRGSRAAFCSQRLESPRRFDRRSFRTVVQDGHRITVGCPTGQYDARRRRCRTGTRAQRILHPEGERGTCPIGGHEANPLAPEQRDRLERELRELYERASALYGEIYGIRKAHFQPTHIGLGTWGRQLPLSERAGQRVQEIQRTRGRVMGRARRVKRQLEGNPRGAWRELARRGFQQTLPAGASVALTVDTYEGEWTPTGPGAQPVVRHVFFGRTRQEAAANFRAHQQSDSFFRAGFTRRPWRGIRVTNLRLNPVTKIYDRVLEVRAVKGRESHFPGEAFVHRFASKAGMYGLPSGRVMIG